MVFPGTIAALLVERRYDDASRLGSIILLSLLAGAVFVGHYGWVSAGDVVMPPWGWLMLCLGVFLLFSPSRRVTKLEMPLIPAAIAANIAPIALMRGNRRNPIDFSRHCDCHRLRLRFDCSAPKVLLNQLELFAVP